MATVNDWQKYINLLHEHALVEDDLRTRARVRHSMGPNDWEDGQIHLAEIVLFERFGVDV